ncbi:MAG: DPP IV N-terminal domain-containing protein [Phycisphaerae bacterium]
MRGWMVLGWVVFVLSGCSLSPCVTVGPDGPGASVADGEFLRQYALTRGFSAGHPRSISLTPDGKAVLFLRSGPRSRVHDLFEYDVATQTERVVLTAEQILQGADEKLSAQERARRERMRLSARGIALYKLSKDGTRILVPLSGRLFVIDRADGGVTELVSGNGYPTDARFSPDGRFVSCVRDGEVFVIDISTGKETQVTTGAGGYITNGMAEFVAQEEMDRRQGYWWSPDSTTLVYQQNSTAGMETMHIADAMHPDRAPGAWPYPRPGKKNADVKVGLIGRNGGETKWVNWDRERYPYLATVKWPDNAPLTMLVQNRKQTQEALLAVDTDTGSTSVLLVERDDAWVNLDQSMPKWLADGSAFLWLTERSGWWRLELRGRDGRLMHSVTPEGFGLKGFVHLDDAGGVVYVSGSEDPTQTHLYRMRLDGTGPAERLTREVGLHGARFSKDGSVFVHTASTLDGKMRHVVRNRRGQEVGVIDSVAEKPPLVPRIELTKVGPGPGFHAVVVRPRRFVPGQRYPVIVSVYGGPHAQMALANARSYLLQQWMADHGFIVVSIDGRGTPSRGRDWERAIKGNLIEIPLQDQVAGIEALGQTFAEMDLNRVGIYGWSFGGYFSAHAVMQRPDLFDAGVAGAPVAAWEDYDTHYTERYLGMPQDNAAGYEASSVMTYCDRLEKPLLIIHGTADDNVYFMHSLKMTNALFRSGKSYEFLALSDFTHMVREPEVTVRLYERIMEFLSKALAEAE